MLVYILLNYFLVFYCLILGGSEALDSEIYEIDYRGPETHSFVPPPNHSHGKTHSPHHKSYADANRASMKQKVSF